MGGSITYQRPATVPGEAHHPRLIAERAGEVAVPAGLDGADGERDGEVGLAAAGLAEAQDGSVLADKPHAGEVLDELPVDARLELEVEVLDGLLEREACVAESGTEAPAAGRGGYLGQEPGEEVDVGPFRGRASSARESRGSGGRGQEMSLRICSIPSWRWVETR